MPPLLSCERHQRCLQWCHLWWKRWEIVMTISFLLIGATFSGVTLFKMGLRQDLYGYSFLVVFIFCLLGLGASLAYGGLILYKREYKGTRRQEECTSTLLSNQDCHRNSVMGETQYHSKPPPQNYSDVSLPLSTPPPSYHSIPLALEVAAANQIQPIYNARGRDSRSSSISYHPTEAPPGNCYPPMYEEAVGESSSRAFLSGSRGIYPYHWPFPPCEGAQWIDPRMGGYSREAVELHNMYHFLVEEEGWISPLMTVSEEDEARRRRFQLIFDHDFFY